MELNFYIQKAVFIPAQSASEPTTGQCTSALYPALRSVSKMQDPTFFNCGTLVIVLNTKTEGPTRANTPLFHIPSWRDFSSSGSHRFFFQNVLKTLSWFPFQLHQVILRYRKFKFGIKTKTIFELYSSTFWNRPQIKPKLWFKCQYHWDF